MEETTTKTNPEDTVLNIFSMLKIHFPETYLCIRKNSVHTNNALDDPKLHSYATITLCDKNKEFKHEYVQIIVANIKDSNITNLRIERCTEKPISEDKLTFDFKDESEERIKSKAALDNWWYPCFAITMDWTTNE